MSLALRPVLRACAATTLAAVLTATTVLPATAVPTAPASPPGGEQAAVADAGQPDAGQPAAEVTGEDQETLEVTGIDPEALSLDPEAEVLAQKATADTDAETVQEAEDLAPTALPAEDTELVAALTAPAETIDFVVAGVTWDAQSAADVTEVSVRVREDGAWTDWSSLEIHAENVRPGADRTGTEPIVSSGADAVQARVSTADGTVPEDLQVQIINPGVAETDGALAPASPASPAPPESAASATSAVAPNSVAAVQASAPDTASTQAVVNTSNALRPAIVTRAQWGANEALVRDFGRPATKLKAMYIHHTAGSNNYTKAGAVGQIRGIFSYHTVSLQWGDIGYQFLVDKFGTIYQGRRGSIDAPVQGAQAGGFNTDTIGVSAMGNFDVAAAPAVMVTAIERVLAWQGHRYGVNPTGTTRLTQSGKGTARWTSGSTHTVPTILGHKVTNLTACPGRYLDAKIPSIRTNVASRIKQAASPAPTPPAPKPTPAPATPGLPSGHYALDGTGTAATARWNAVSGATGYQVMYRSVPHGGGNINQQAWKAGKTGTSTSTTLTNAPGETAQYAVRAVRNGVPGPQRYLGQHTAPLGWSDASVHTAAMTSVADTAGVGGRGIRTNGQGAALRIEGAQQADRLYVKARSASGTAVVRVERDGRYVGSLRVASGGTATCTMPLAAGSNVRLELANSATVTFSSVALTRAGQSAGLGTTNQRCDSPFSDVAPTASYFRAVDWMQAEGITKGYAQGNQFRPTRNITRGESVALIYRAVAPRHSAGNRAPFNDVPTGHSFFVPISWASEARITQGYAGTNLFGVGRNVTRAEFASFLYRAAGPSFRAPSGLAFKDLSRSSAHNTAIAWLKQEKLSTGYSDGTFRPNQPITRAEVALLMHRYYAGR